MSNSEQMHRRHFLGLAGATTVSVAALAAGCASRAGDDIGQPRPNIVFILADDLGWGDLSRYGRTDYRTPHIDSIGEQGISFTDGYANSCLCSPTREAFFTGQYQQRIPQDELLADDTHGIPPETPTIATLLNQVGYRTALIGKWHCGLPPQFGPLKSGFQYFYGFHNGEIDYFGHTAINADKADSNRSPNVPTMVPDLWENDQPISEQGYSTQLFTDRAVNYIETSAKTGQPFYLSLHYNAVHWPWESPQSGPHPLRTPEDLNASPEVFTQMVTALDSHVGRVLEALERTGIADNTLVVFTSDNGGERYGHEYPFNGQKGNLYEGGIRVPMMARWPDRIPASQITRQVAITMDWTATIAAAAGTSAAAGHPFDGIDLSPHMFQRQPETERTLYWRFNMADDTNNGASRSGQAALRKGKYKYLKLTDNIEQLYDLSAPISLPHPASGADPEAADRNLSDKPEHAALLAELRESYLAWDASMPSPSHIPRQIAGTNADARLKPGGNEKPGGYPLPFQK